MFVKRLQVHDFRSYADAELQLSPGLNVIRGDNGAGKTNLLEAVSYLASTRSFRGAPTDALVRIGVDRAVVRADAQVRDRALLIEAEIVPSGRSRMLVNKQSARSTADRRDGLAVTVFSPDNLIIVKGGPGERREVLDGVLTALHPRNDAMLKELDRVLRQRNALLKQSGGRLSAEVGFTLDVWDTKLASTGDAVVSARMQLLEVLAPFVQGAYNDVADMAQRLTLHYRCSYEAGRLAEALASGRNDDVRRGLSLLGPHRDDIELSIEGRPSRTHASQGEQRTLALAVQLGAHRLLAERLESTPVLLLDDVFSELDPTRSDALIRHLPPGQALLATAGVVPPAAVVDSTFMVRRSDTSSVFQFDGNEMSQLNGHSELTAVDKPVESVDESADLRVEPHDMHSTLHGDFA